MSERAKSLSIVPEPYEDPSLDPGFVRSTKQYLKQSHIKKVQDDIKREERDALNISKCNDDLGTDRELFTSALSFMDKQKERDSAQKTMYSNKFK